MSTHLHYMQRALMLAERGRLTVSPNPMVGCVIVHGDTIVGEGFHQRAGEPHAEIHALSMAGDAAQNATAYVTLEPCCHHGRTPPCTDALIRAGIKKVVVACQDPNPLMAGNGIAALQKASIEVEMGVLSSDAAQLNEVFFHYITHKQPFVIAKWAMSLDGKTITHTNDDRKISGAAAHLHAHDIRQTVDAILVGKNTAVQDNPLLTVRINSDRAITKQPLRIILTSNGDLPMNLQVLQQQNIANTLIVSTKKISVTQHESLKKTGVDILLVDENAQGRIDLKHLLTMLGKRGIASLLVEGGKQIHDSFFAENLVNKVNVYLAPVIISKLEKKITVSNVCITNMQPDYYFTATYKNEINQEITNV